MHRSFRVCRLAISRKKYLCQRGHLPPPNQLLVLHLYIAALIVSLSAVMLLEAVLPLHPGTSISLPRWLRNLSLAALALGVTILASILFWSTFHALGVLPEDGALATLGMPLLAQWLITFLLLDGAAYGLHRLSHTVPWLWRLHAVHHSDPELDATTTHRHHPLENLVAALITLPILLFLAPPVWAVLAYNMIAVAVSTLSHGNLALPNWLDKGLRHFIVTPAFHRMHHSAAREQTDSNYATVFPVFDLVFRSATPAAADKGRSLKIGLDTVPGSASQSLAALLLFPFRRSVKS